MYENEFDILHEKVPSKNTVLLLYTNPDYNTTIWILSFHVNFNKQISSLGNLKKNFKKIRLSLKHFKYPSKQRKYNY